MHICHLLSMEAPRPGHDRACLDSAVLACRHVIARTREHEHTVLLFGPDSFERRVLSLGIDTTDRIACASNDPRRAQASMRSYMQTRRSFDVLTCWSERTLSLWQRSGWLGLDAVGVMLAGPEHIHHLDKTPVVALDRLDADAWQERGAEIHQSALPIDDLLPDDSARRDWRESLGAEEGDLIIAVLDDPASECDALWLCHMLVVLEYRGLDMIGLTPADPAHWTRAKHVHRNMNLRSPMMRIEGPTHKAGAMCDLCVMRSDGSRRGARAMMIAQAHAAGVPVCGSAGLADLVSYPPLARVHCLAKAETELNVGERLSALADSPILRRRLRTCVKEHDASDGLPSLSDTLGSIWAHAPSNRRAMVTMDAAGGLR